MNSTESDQKEYSVFQKKYNEFVEDLLAAIPEYSTQINEAKILDDATRLSRFQKEVKIDTMGMSDSDSDNKFNTNPDVILPGVQISNNIWVQLSENTKKAIWEYKKILSICCFLEAGFSANQTNDSMNDMMNNAMNDMKQKLDGIDFQNIIKKFMTFLKPEDGMKSEGDGNQKTNADSKNQAEEGFDGMFKSFPKLPEKFFKGHLAKLAQEIIKDITPEDLGLSKDLIDECEKNPSRAFDVLFKVFSQNPEVIQKTVQKIGKNLQQKILTGAIRPKEIAREAEELIKEFSENSSFVDMLSGLKSVFGFEDMDLARQAGREGSARLAAARERLRKKASEKEAKKMNNQIVTQITPDLQAKSDSLMAELLLEEANKRNDSKKKPGKGGKK